MTRGTKNQGFPWVQFVVWLIVVLVALFLFRDPIAKFIGNAIRLMPAPEWFRSMLGTIVEWFRNIFATIGEWIRYTRPLLRLFYILFGLRLLCAGAYSYIRAPREIKYSRAEMAYARGDMETYYDYDRERKKTKDDRAFAPRKDPFLIIPMVVGGLLIIAGLWPAFVLALLTLVFELTDAVGRKRIPKIVLSGTFIVWTVLAWMGP
jgi:hypothetical protein